MSHPTPRGSPPICPAASACSTPRSCSAWQPYISAPHIVGAIVVFRLYYYIIPLFLAGFLFTGNEILLRGGGCCGASERLGAMQALARWSEPDFAVASATGLVALCGVMLLCVGILAPQPDFSWIDPDFAEMANQAGQFIPSLIGAGLIVLAIGLSQRVNLAWGATIFLLVVGAAFTATQGERLWIAGVLVVVAMLVAPLRRMLLPPCQPAERAAGTGQRGVAVRAGDLSARRWPPPGRACTCWRTTPGGRW